MYKNYHNGNNYYLCITSLFFLLGFFYYLLYSKKNVSENVLGITLFITFVVSEIFWFNPERFSISHKIDGFIAKVTLWMFLIYTIFYKNLENSAKIFYIFAFGMLCVTFYYSNLNSSLDWCCDEHVLYHMFFHLITFIGIPCAFYPS
jgi:hypothetical protein